jgi:crossover junction endodeoxyribonuclease RuvC
MKFLGVDIGVQGAIAVLDESEQLVEVHDLPVLQDGPASRRTINAALLAGIIGACHADKAFVEHVAARPGEGAVGAFAFGRSRGVIDGVLGALKIPVTFITPASWKRTLGLAGASKGCGAIGSDQALAKTRITIRARQR